MSATHRPRRWTRRCLRGARRLAAGLLASLIVLALLAWLTPQGRAAYNTSLFVSQIVPSLPSVTWFQQAPLRSRVQVPTPEGTREAHLYRPPGNGPFAAVVVFLGVAPAGPDDPRVVNLGQALARSGFATLVYWSPEKLAGRIHPPDVGNLVSAFQHLREQPFVDPDRVGFAGFCVGAAFALVAAAQPEIAADVAFVNAFGPYADLRELAVAVGTRAQTLAGVSAAWEPDKLTSAVTQRMLVEALPSPEEQVRVMQAIAGDVGAATGLSPAGEAVYRIIAGGSEDAVRAAIPALPPALLERMRQASPMEHLAGLRAPVLLMHDRADNLVPVEQSRRLAAALASTVPLRYTEFSLFQHVDPTRELGLLERGRELWKLYAHLYGIMRQAT